MADVQVGSAGDQARTGLVAHDLGRSHDGTADSGT